MAESYNEDLLTYLEGERSRINQAITAIREMQDYGANYTTANKNTLIATIKTKTGSEADEYVGNAKPQDKIMNQEVTMDDVTKIVGSKEIELILLRSENQRLKDELALVLSLIHI